MIRIIFGILTAALSLTVLLGWHTNNIALIQISSHLMPVQYNAALSLLFSSIGILSLKNTKILLFFSTLIFLISILTLIQYIAGINIGLDQLFMKSAITTYTSHPGRMAPNTAACFLFVSIMFFAIGFSNKFKWGNLIALLLCIIIGIMGLVSLTGYALGVTALYAWGNFTAMAAHTAAGFLFISISSFSFMLNRFLKDHLQQNYLPLIIISAIGIPLFLISWQALTMYQNNVVKKMIAEEAIYGEIALESLLSNRFDAMKRLFFRGTYHDNYKTDFWKKDVTTYFSTYPTLQSVFAEDATGKIYLYARDPSRQSIAKQNTAACKALLTLKNKNFNTQDKNIMLATNTELLCIENNTGTMIAVFDMKELFSLIFNATIWKHYGIELKNQGNLLFLKDIKHLNAAFKKQWGRSRQLSLFNQPWSLEVWPSEQFVRNQISLFPEVFLIFGLLIVVLLAIVMHMRQLATFNNKLLKQSNDELELFAYAASHDLKTPLNVINNASKWIEEDLREHITPEIQENINLLRKRVLRMDKLLDDLLEYSLVKNKKSNVDSSMVSGNTLIEGVLELLSIPEGFTVTIDPKFKNIRVKKMPLEQIFLQLTDNAIKHHDKKTGHVTISVKENKTNYIFSVKDDGPGIPQQYHEKIFKLLQTLKPRDQVEGSGMGLSIAKKNVELFGGKLSLQSTENNGSTFSFTWPKINIARWI